MKINLSPTNAMMLGLLHDGPMTGGDLFRNAEKWLGPYWTTTRSQVYRDLPGLAERGYVKAGEPGSRGSIEYKITAAGKKAFQRWLNDDPAEDMIRIESILRVSFGRLHKGDSLSDLLGFMRNRHELALGEAIALHDEARQEEMPYDELALKFAVMYHQAMIGWLETVELPE